MLIFPLISTLGVDIDHSSKAIDSSKLVAIFQKKKTHATL